MPAHNLAGSASERLRIREVLAEPVLRRLMHLDMAQRLPV